MLEELPSETLQAVTYSQAIGTYSFQTKPVMMEAVPDGISQHANVC